MHFLPDVYVPCEVCKGARYNRDTLDIEFKGKNIADVLDMPVAEAVEFFANQPSIGRYMQTLVDVGLGYVRLGQPAPTLSGGEAQRVKLATELAKRSTGHTIYLLDEPTTGLHFDDVRRLLTVLSRLVDQGNTVLVIEHNLDVIKTADWIIDLGPEGGSGGGRSSPRARPSTSPTVEGSHTGRYLRDLLAERARPAPIASAICSPAAGDAELPRSADASTAAHSGSLRFGRRPRPSAHVGRRRRRGVAARQGHARLRRRPGSGAPPSPGSAVIAVPLAASGSL